MPATREITSTRAAIDDFLRAADRCAANWTVPRAPGKWSPSQVVEHVARSLEASAEDMQGRTSGLPQLVAPLRFLVRTLLFRRVLRTSSFPRAKTNRAMDPAAGPDSCRKGRERIEAAWRMFEGASATVASSGSVVADSRVFGRVPLGDYLRFQELHTRHHESQLTTP